MSKNFFGNFAITEIIDLNIKIKIFHKNIYRINKMYLMRKK